MSETVLSESSTPSENMAETVAVKSRKKIIKKERVAKVTKSVETELEEFKTWLNGLELGIQPVIHVNGALFLNCVMTVDFGTPKAGIKLTPEQSAELVVKMRNATKLIIGKETKIGILNDHSSGVWWTTATG